MKNYILSGLMLFAIAMSGCKPEIKEIGTEYTAGDGIYGSWVISSLSQVDLKQPIPETRDVSSFFNSSESNKMILRFDKENNSYSVVQAGVLPRFFGTGGTWAYDATPYPTALHLYTSNGDTLEAPLANMPRENDTKFGFNIERTDTCGTVYLRYIYSFNRVQ
jgi:hypothetical protein